MVRASVYILMALVLTASLTGCEAKSRHQVLTFFFTGVPPLDESEVTRDNEEKQSPSEMDQSKKVAVVQVLYSHPIWAAGTCTSCHESTGTFSLPGVVQKQTQSVFKTGGGMPGKLTLAENKICIQCHQDKTPLRALTEKLWLHNTTARGDCLACHDPHQSKNENILRKPSATLCLPCHEKGSFRETPVHQSEAECLSCHNPHMGLNKTLLTREYQERKINANEYPEAAGSRHR